MPQLWRGRASKAVDSRVNDFNSSIRFDARMIEQDIQGSLSTLRPMLGRQGIISPAGCGRYSKGSALHFGRFAQRRTGNRPQRRGRPHLRRADADRPRR